jgi:multidrug transporter EmrE-like cation transporter
MNNALLYIFIGALFDTFGDLLMKSWVENSSASYFVSGMCFYVVALSFLAYSFTLKNMMVASVLFLIINIFLLTIANSCFFNEILTRKEYLALGFGIVAIILFEIK